VIEGTEPASRTRAALPLATAEGRARGAFEPRRMAMAVVRPVLALALACAVVPRGASALPAPSTVSHAVPLAVAAGNCPRSVVLSVRTKQYEGGAEFTVRVDARRFVSGPPAVRRAAGRVDFSAPLARAFRTCVATAATQSDGSSYAFGWRDGTWHFTMRPSREMQVMRAQSPGNDPTIVLAVAD
jgi:hypothetical protein